MVVFNIQPLEIDNAALPLHMDYTPQNKKYDSTSNLYAAGLYKKYCALCHGDNREGDAADYAPSLRSKSLMATTQKPRSSFNFLVHTISYGRIGTSMAPYAKSQGGPLDEGDIEALVQWLHETSGVKEVVEMSTDPVIGDIPLGKTLYNKHCIKCHGVNGEGVTAPALANRVFLATASDAFMRYTIAEGRENTLMKSYKDSLGSKEIDAITAYLRSRAAGWNAPVAINMAEASNASYVINPKGKSPSFTLKDGMYISAEQLNNAIKDSTRMILLDARSKAAWYQSHIPGSISVPYYQDATAFIKDIPKDDTWVIAYCACPHAASTIVVNGLRKYGYKNTGVLDEGILIWVQRGYPVQYGTGQ